MLLFRLCLIKLALMSDPNLALFTVQSSVCLIIKHKIHYKPIMTGTASSCRCHMCRSDLPLWVTSITTRKKRAEKSVRLGTDRRTNNHDTAQKHNKCYQREGDSTRVLQVIVYSLISQDQVLLEHMQQLRLFPLLNKHRDVSAEHSGKSHDALVLATHATLPITCFNPF